MLFPVRSVACVCVVDGGFTAPTVTHSPHVEQYFFPSSLASPIGLCPFWLPNVHVLFAPSCLIFAFVKASSIKVITG